MNDLIVYFLIITGVLVIAGSIFFFVNQKQKREKQNLIKFTNQNGWKIEHIRKPLAKGVRIIAWEWELEAITRSSGWESGPGSSDLEQKTTWFANKPGTTILVGPKTTQVDMAPLAEKLAKKVMRTAMGKDADNLKALSIGSSDFQEKFMVWAQDSERIDLFLTPSLQYALLNWERKPPLIKRTSRGTSIELIGTHLKNPDDILALISLGEHLL